MRSDPIAKSSSLYDFSRYMRHSFHARYQAYIHFLGAQLADGVLPVFRIECTDGYRDYLCLKR